jgi:hypothetical protein
LAKTSAAPSANQQRRTTPVCAENLVRVDPVMESRNVT